MESVILNSTMLFLKDILSSYKINPSLATLPVMLEKPVYEEKAPRFLTSVAPGMMLSIIFILAIHLTALIFVWEKKEGLLERSWIAGVTAIEVTLSHIIVKFFIQFVQISFLITFVKIFLKVCFIFTYSVYLFFS